MNVVDPATFNPTSTMSPSKVPIESATTPRPTTPAPITAQPTSSPQIPLFLPSTTATPTIIPTESNVTFSPSITTPVTEAPSTPSDEDTTKSPSEAPTVDREAKSQSPTGAGSANIDIAKDEESIWLLIAIALAGVIIALCIIIVLLLWRNKRNKLKDTNLQTDTAMEMTTKGIGNKSKTKINQAQRVNSYDSDGVTDGMYDKVEIHTPGSDPKINGSNGNTEGQVDIDLTESDDAEDMYDQPKDTGNMVHEPNSNEAELDDKDHSDADSVEDIYDGRNGNATMGSIDTAGSPR